jgi:hypothetical protein
MMEEMKKRIEEVSANPTDLAVLAIVSQIMEYLTKESKKIFKRAIDIGR